MIIRLLFVLIYKMYSHATELGELFKLNHFIK